MFITLTCIAIAVIGVIISNNVEFDEMSRREAIATIYGALAFILLGIVFLWFAFGIPRGQYPEFSLLPPTVVGCIFAAMALRANAVARKG